MNQELVQAIRDQIKQTANEMHTALPGIIVEFDPSTAMATVKPSMKYIKPDGTTIDFPEVSGIPVVFPQGAGQAVSIAFPVAAGDSCMLVFSEQSLDYWQYGQETGTDLRFDLSNAMCIPGLFQKGNPAIQKACSENAAVLMSGAVSLTVSGSGVVIEGNLTVKGKIVSTGDTVAIGKSLATHTHTCPDGSTSVPK